MKWRCNRIQGWLPEYLAGELALDRGRKVAAHLEGCLACRRELAEQAGVIEAVMAQPVAEMGPEFWEDFSRELHLKLVQASPAPAAPRPFFRRAYFLIGAPALAVLLLMLTTHLWHSGNGALTSLSVPDQLVYASEEDGLWQETEEGASWDVESVMADLTPKEREIVLKRISF